ncbi:MAG: phospholipase/carboxylesterase [Aureliella sp.]
MTEFKYRANRETISQLDCVTVLPETASGESVAPVALAVFCHGFGAGGDDLVGLAGELLQTLSVDSPVALVFPAAPIDLTDSGMPGGRAWWLLSIQSLLSAMEEGRYEQIRMQVPEGIDDARQKLTDVVESTLTRFSLDHSRLLLGGFSQGAMLSVEVATSGLSAAPAALALYSGALICEKKWSAEAGRLKQTAIFQSHGTQDPILPLQTGVWLQEMLEEAGCAVDFVKFVGPHTIPTEALTATAAMLSKLAS